MCALYIQILGSVPFPHVGPELRQTWRCYHFKWSTACTSVSCICLLYKKPQQLFIHIVSCLKLAEGPRYLSDADWRAKDSNTCFSAAFPQSQASVCSQVRGRGSSVQTQLVDPHHLNICFTLAAQRVHTRWYTPAVTVKLKRCWRCIFCWSLRKEEEEETTKTAEEGKRRGETRESAWPWVFWAEVSGPSLGEGVWPAVRRYWTNTNGTLSTAGESHVWLRWKHWRHADTLRWLTQQTCILTRTHEEAAATIKATWSKLVPADTSHAHDLNINKRSTQSQHTREAWNLTEARLQEGFFPANWFQKHTPKFFVELSHTKPQQGHQKRRQAAKWWLMCEETVRPMFNKKLMEGTRREKTREAALVRYI